MTRPTAFNPRGVTLAAVGVGLLTIGWLTTLDAPFDDYVGFAGWALGAVGTVLHVRDNNNTSDGPS